SIKDIPQENFFSRQFHLSRNRRVFMTESGYQNFRRIVEMIDRAALFDGLADFSDIWDAWFSVATKYLSSGVQPDDSEEILQDIMSIVHDKIEEPHTARMENTYKGLRLTEYGPSATRSAPLRPPRYSMQAQRPSTARISKASPAHSSPWFTHPASGRADPIQGKVQTAKTASTPSARRRRTCACARCSPVASNVAVQPSLSPPSPAGLCVMMSILFYSARPIAACSRTILQMT